MYNEPTLAQRERLAWLMEECAEVIAACGKALRHGLKAIDPNTGKVYNNLADIQSELSHVQAATALMVSADELDVEAMAQASMAKVSYVIENNYLHHNRFT